MNKIIFDPYIMYGLNRRRKFLKSPVCEDCGGKGTIVLRDDGALEDFCCGVMLEHDCDNCAVFIVHVDESYSVYFKMETGWSEEEDEPLYSIGRVDGDDRKLFSMVDGEFRFCCYSLLIEKEEGLYEIQD